MTDAINLKYYDLSEADKIVVMYSREKGLIKGVAKGVKKPKSKLGARMDLLVANKLMLSKGRNLDTICEAQALNTFSKTRTNMDKIFYSMYVSEVTHNFGVEDDPNSAEIYELLYKALDAVSVAADKTAVLLAVIKFQLKMMQLCGFGIELENCLCCGAAAEGMYFSARQGGVVCGECASGGVLMHDKIRAFLSSLDFERKSDYEDKATERVCTVCFELLKDYIALHSSKKFKTLLTVAD
jgi:DNA repair protein RecO (recombination protein O)